MKPSSPTEFALLALLLLSLLLPIGMIDSVNSSLFFAIFSLHLIILCFASFHAILRLTKETLQSNKSSKILFFLSFGIVILTILSSAILPVTARDALIHHLAVPKFWVSHGLIYATPWHEWSFYPMLIQLAFTALLQIGPEQLCTFYILLFLPLVLLVTSRIASQLSESRESATLACITLILTPIIIKLSGIALVDLPLVFLCGAGIHYLYKLHEDLEDKKSCFLAGLAWGLALSCKLNALPAFGLAILIFGGLSIQGSQSKIVIRKYIALSLIAAACFSPWLLKNWLWASNPLYPYASSFFGQHIPKFDSGLSGLNPLQQRLMLYGESTLEVILLPIRIFLGGQDENPRQFDGRLSILFLFGLGFGIYSFKKLKYRQITLFSLAFILFALFSTTTRVRYLAPVFISLAALSGTFLHFLASTPKLIRDNIGSLIVTIILILQLLATLYYLKESLPVKEGLAYAQGNLSKTEYLSEKIPEYPIIQYCNSRLPEDAKISLVYTGNQFYLYDRQVFSSGHTSADQLLDWLRHSLTIDDFRSKVKESGLTHFVIEDSRLASVLETAITQDQRQIWNSFVLQNLNPEFLSRGFTLYNIQ